MAEASSTGGWQAGLTRRTGRFGDDKDPNVGADTQFKPGQSGNPAGPKKGRKSLSTVIQEMMNDPKFIDKLSEKVKEKAGIADEDFQDTPMKAIITTALLEAMHPSNDPAARGRARDWLRKAGYGDKIDITSDGERLQQAPIVVSTIHPRPDGDDTQLDDTNGAALPGQP